MVEELAAVEPLARVKLVRAENAKVNGITIEIHGDQGELSDLVDRAFAEFTRAIQMMQPLDPQSASK